MLFSAYILLGLIWRACHYVLLGAVEIAHEHFMKSTVVISHVAAWLKFNGPAVIQKGLLVFSHFLISVAPIDIEQ